MGYLAALRNGAYRFREAASKAALQLACWASSLLGPGTAEPGLHRTVVFTGPLRGMRLSMPTLERLSYALGTYRSHVVYELRQHLFRGAVAYDVGAHVGYLALVMSRGVGLEGKVYAFEPDPQNLRALRTNVTGSGAANVTVVPRALAAESRTLEFATFDYSLVGHIADESVPDDANLIEIPAVSLDDFVYGEGHPPPDILKIAVTGHELDVFVGARRTLAEYAPPVVVLCPGDPSPELDRLIDGLGYRRRVFGWTAGLPDVLLYVKPEHAGRP